ncbi:MAG: hypothetical protein M0024_07185 [Nitrospiraceae bacterium]|nr:hypothetical protein [Nitrospiraceae bacterium]
MKKVLSIAVSAAIAFGGYLAYTTVDSNTAIVTAAKKTYAGTTFVAGMGGHFAKADITIDPNNAADPISVANLDRVIIGDSHTHPTHDPRIDVNDNSVMFWSTYKLDNGKMHIGKTDLKTGKIIKDVALDPDKRAPGEKGPIYCASGQTKVSYLPVFMGSEAFIDVFSKKTLEHKHRVFISDLGYKEGSYIFLHGTNSHDMKKFILTMTMKGDDGKLNGKIDFVMVDLPALEKGKLKVLARSSYTGEPGKTITFREYFSPDDTLIFQSAADRFLLLDAKTLKVVDEKITQPMGENHDAMPTPDGKYAILTLRSNDTQSCDIEGKPIQDKKITDGVLMVYDVDAKKLIGKTKSVCFDCHKGMGLGDKSAVLCGLDTNFKK